MCFYNGMKTLRSIIETTKLTDVKKQEVYSKPISKPTECLEALYTFSMMSGVEKENQYFSYVT